MLQVTIHFSKRKNCLTGECFAWMDKNSLLHMQTTPTSTERKSRTICLGAWDEEVKG